MIFDFSEIKKNRIKYISIFKNRIKTRDENINIYKLIIDLLSEKNEYTFKTSGSTGKPKKIVFTKDDLIKSSLLSKKIFKIKKNSNSLLCLPTDYIAGKMVIIRAFFLELNLIIQKPTNNPFKNMKNIDLISVVPMQLENGIKNNFNNVKSIKNILVGGASINNIIEKSKLKNVFVTYGMTETLTHVAIRKLNQKFFRCIGNVKFSIDGRNCLKIYAPHLRKKNIQTNDIVKLLSPNKFSLIGRIDNIINTGGVKVYPEKIENKINHLINEKYFISSIPDEKLSQKIILLIESEKLSKTNINNLNNQMRKRLSKFEMPKNIYTIKKFRYSKTGKILRNETTKQINFYNKDKV